MHIDSGQHVKELPQHNLSEAQEPDSSYEKQPFPSKFIGASGHP